jgi:hypothetical protein
MRSTQTLGVFDTKKARCLAVIGLDDQLLNQGLVAVGNGQAACGFRVVCAAGAEAAGFAAGAFGLGGGSIYNPALLALGVQPRVAAATGMYLVMYSCVNACVVNGIQGIL